MITTIVESIVTVDSFLLMALLGGLGVVLVSGPLGCFVVWRRMSYFGSALSHAALLGVALGMMLEMHVMLAVLIFSLIFAVTLVLLERQRLLPTDTLLGIIAHSALAIGLLVVAVLDRYRIDLMAYLFGDVLATTGADVVIIFALAVFVLAGLKWIWRDLLAITISADLAAAEGVAVERVKLIFVLMVACVIAIGMKIVGILLIITLLIVPAAAARAFAHTPEQMAAGSVVIGALSVALGLAGSYYWDVPAGPAMVAVATGVFVIAHSLSAIKRLQP